MDKNELHKKYLEKLQNIEIKEFQGIKIRNVLFNNIFYAFDNSQFKLYLKKIKYVFFKSNRSYNYINNDKEILLFSENHNRKDYDNYWNNFKSIIKEFNEIKINSASGKSISKDFRKKNKLFKSFYKQLDVIDNKICRYDLAIQLLKIYDFKEFLDTVEYKGKYFVSFFDGNITENFASQYFKQKGITTVTLQHGQFMVYDYEKALVNQSGIFNFVSDYILCWGEFTKRQFLKDNVVAERVVPLGNLSKLDMKTEKYKDVKNKVICLFLDAPGWQFYQKTNKMLFDLLNDFCKKYGYKYFAKIHPADDALKYQGFVDDNYFLGFKDKNMSLDEVTSMAEFSVFEASSIYIDLLIRSSKAFKLNTSFIDYDIVMDEEENFSTIDELMEKVTKWNKNSIEEKEKYFDKAMEYYANNKDIVNRYKNFFQIQG